MGTKYGGNIVNNGLVLYLDAANSKSYPGDGSIWYDLSPNHYDASLYGPIQYSSENKGTLLFDVSTKYAILTNNFDTYSANAIFTIQSAFRTIFNNFGAIFTNHIDRTNITYSLYTSSGIPYINFRIGGTSFDVGPLTTGATRDLIFYLCLRVNKQLDTADFFLNVGGRNDIILPYTYRSVNPGANTGFNQNMIGGFATGDAYSNTNIYNFIGYNRWISNDEVKQNYNALKGRYGL